MHESFEIKDSVVDNALACHLYSPGSNLGQGKWKGSGSLSKLDGFPWVHRFPPPLLTTSPSKTHIYTPI